MAKNLLGGRGKEGTAVVGVSSNQACPCTHRPRAWGRWASSKPVTGGVGEGRFPFTMTSFFPTRYTSLGL